jgi:hypothetical protein
LVERGIISFDTAYPYFEDVEKRAQLQKRYYRVANIPRADAPRAPAATPGSGSRR